MYTSKWATIVKSNAKYQCVKCGSTERLQAHDPTGKHTDPKDGMCLCAEHHAHEHPKLPRSLFFNKTNQPYWNNISASSLAKELGTHPRTIIRVAKRLHIPMGSLSDVNKLNIKKTATAHGHFVIDTLPETDNQNLDMLTTNIVAKGLHIHINTLYRYINSGELKAIKLGGDGKNRHLRIKRADLDQFITQSWNEVKK